MKPHFFIVVLLMLLACMADNALAAIGRVGKTNGYSISTSSRSITFPELPANLAQGDLMIAILVTSGPTLTSVTRPASWNTGEQRLGNGINQVLFWKFAGASESTSNQFGWQYSGAADSKDSAFMVIIAYRGVDSSSPFLASSTSFIGTSGTSISAPSITPGVENARLVAYFSLGRRGGLPVSYTASMGNISAYDVGTGQGGLTHFSADEVLTASTATGTRTVIYSESSTRNALMVALRPAVSTLDHIRILHTGSAVTCEAASVTFRACADASCSTRATTDVSVTASPASGWTGGSTFTIPAGSDITRSLAITTPQSVTLGVSSASPSAANATRCFAGATETCTLSFADSGFLFSTIPTQTAGSTTSSHTLRAVRKSDNSATCTGLFTGSVNVELASQCVNPTTCAGRQVSINGNAIASNPASAVSTYTPVALTFGSNATASFNLAYPDTGSVGLSARYALSGTGTVAGSSNTFVVKPAGFSIGNVRRNSDALANPAAASATGALFARAGQAFSATVTALTTGGVAAPNFGRESTPEGVVLNAELATGLGLSTNPGLSGNNTSNGDFVNGVATLGALSWDEVGIIRLRPSVRDGDFLGVGNVSGDTAGNASTTIGRFAPARFDVSVTQGCATGGDAPYTYAGQPFSASIFARRASGQTALNYQGDFAKDLNLAAVGASTVILDDGEVPASAGRFVSGVGTTTTPSLRFDSIPGTPVEASIRATDTDGTTSASLGSEGVVSLYSGRMQMTGAFGAGSEALVLPVALQRWEDINPPNGRLAWNTAQDDDCTSVTTGDFEVSSGGITSTITAATLTSGRGSVTLAPANAAGTIDVTARADVFAPWLQFDWDGDGTAENPSARAGFEFNAGDSRQIFKRDATSSN